MFRRDPETRAQWTEEKSYGCAARQTEILREAARFVRPGGRLVYATCTYNPAENEETVNRFLQEHSDFSPESFCFPGVDGREGFFLCLPHRITGEGQFAAKLRKSGTRTESTLKRPFQMHYCAESGIFQEQLPGLPLPNFRFGDIFTCMPDAPGLNNVRILRAGLHLAQIRGKNLFPDHASAVCFFPAETEGWTKSPNRDIMKPPGGNARQNNSETLSGPLGRLSPRERQDHPRRNPLCRNPR